MTLRLMSVNLHRGAADRWPALAEVIQETAPDVLCLQEATGWQENDHLGRRCEELRMRGVLAPARSRYPTGLLWREPQVHLTDWDTSYAGETLHGFGVARLRVGADRTPLTVVSTHLTPYSATAAALEIQVQLGRLLRAAGAAGAGILAGDLNTLPVGDDEPPWELIPPHDRVARALPEDGPPRGNRIVGHILACCLIDVAAHLADQRHDPTLRAPTGRGRIRVDQVHVTPALAATVTDYRRIETAASDHTPIVVDISTVQGEVTAG